MLLFVASIFVFRRSSYELLPQTDEGEVHGRGRDCRSASASSARKRRWRQLEGSHPQGRARGADAGRPAVGGGASRARGGQHRGTITVILVAARRARALQRRDRDRRCGAQLAGLPGMIVRARPSGGNFQLNRILGGGTDARLALEIRGYDLDDARRLVARRQAR